MAMRLRLAAVALLCAVACESHPKNKTTVVEATPKRELPAEFEKKESVQTIRRTEKLVQQYQELLFQGKLQQATALKRTIGQTIDDNLAVYVETAQTGELTTLRDLAVRGLGFSNAKKKEAHDALQALLNDRSPTIVANAALSLGILRWKETDLTLLIERCSSGDPEIRTNAATALRDIFAAKPTPRELTPEYRAAIDRLLALLQDPTQVRGRRAAIWALANLHHPDMLDHLVAALEDEDDKVQIGALFGLEKLADQRCLEPVLKYMEQGLPEGVATWAEKVLRAVAIEGGFTKDPAELEPLGASSRRWRDWFNTARMR